MLGKNRFKISKGRTMAHGSVRAKRAHPHPQAEKEGCHRFVGKCVNNIFISFGVGIGTMYVGMSIIVPILTRFDLAENNLETTGLDIYLGAFATAMTILGVTDLWGERKRCKKNMSVPAKKQDKKSETKEELKEEAKEESKKEVKKEVKKKPKKEAKKEPKKELKKEVKKKQVEEKVESKGAPLAVKISSAMVSAPPVAVRTVPIPKGVPPEDSVVPRAVMLPLLPKTEEKREEKRSEVQVAPKAVAKPPVPTTVSSVVAPSKKVTPSSRVVTSSSSYAQIAQITQKMESAQPPKASVTETKPEINSKDQSNEIERLKLEVRDLQTEVNTMASLGVGMSMWVPDKPPRYIKGGLYVGPTYVRAPVPAKR